jgi:serine/threonine protein kinase
MVNAISVRLGLESPASLEIKEQGPRRRLGRVMNSFKEFFMEDLPKFEQFCDLLSKILVYNPKNRLSAKEALNHPFFETDDDLVFEITALSTKRVIILDAENQIVLNDILPEGFSCYHTSKRGAPHTILPSTLGYFDLDSGQKPAENATLEPP